MYLDDTSSDFISSLINFLSGSVCLGYKSRLQKIKIIVKLRDKLMDKLTLEHREYYTIHRHQCHTHFLHFYKSKQESFYLTCFLLPSLQINFNCAYKTNV